MRFFNLFIVLTLSFLSMVGYSKTVPPAKYSGLLWNSVNKDSQFIALVFSEELENGTLARLASAYEVTLVNWGTGGYAAKWANVDVYSVNSNTPIYLNVNTGYIVNAEGKELGVSYSQHPNATMSKGFHINGGAVSISASTRSIFIND